MSNIVDDAMTQLAAIPGLHWEKAEWENFAESDAASQKRMITELVLASGPTAPDLLADAVKILLPIVAVMGGVGTVASGVEAIRDVVKGV